VDLKAQEVIMDRESKRAMHILRKVHSQMIIQEDWETIRDQESMDIIRPDHILKTILEAHKFMEQEITGTLGIISLKIILGELKVIME
jgi:hypothetical protein